MTTGIVRLTSVYETGVFRKVIIIPNAAREQLLLKHVIKIDG